MYFSFIIIIIIIIIITVVPIYFFLKTYYFDTELIRVYFVGHNLKTSNLNTVLSYLLSFRQQVYFIHNV